MSNHLCKYCFTHQKELLRESYKLNTDYHIEKTTIKWHFDLYIWWFTTMVELASNTTKSWLILFHCSLLGAPESVICYVWNNLMYPSKCPREYSDAIFLALLIILQRCKCSEVYLYFLYRIIPSFFLISSTLFRDVYIMRNIFYRKRLLTCKTILKIFIYVEFSEVAV